MSPPTQKRCSSCKDIKPVTEFYRRNAQDGFQAYCKPCHREKYQARQATYRPRRNELYRKYYRADPEKYYWRNLLRRLGLTRQTYEQLLEAQEDACAVCLCAFPTDPIADRKTQRRIYVDHDHTTGVVRGLLCPACNTAVGLLKDDIRNVERLAAYLRRHSQQTTG